MNTPNPERLRELLARATAGPWRIREGRSADQFFVQAPRLIQSDPYDIEVLGEDDALYPTRRADAELIVAMHEALPALLHQLAELQAKTACTMGVGDGSGRLFVHGDYESIKAAQEIVTKLAERDAEVERLRISLGREQHEHNRTKDALAGATETWYDAETGTTWDVPTAWAYAQSCRAREEQRNRAEAAERARDEATGLLRGVVEMHTGENIDGCGMSNASLESIAAFLAASGGK